MLYGYEQFPIIVAALIFLLAGFTKGVIGLGLPTVSMGLLTVIMSPAHAASLLIIPSFITNVWQLAAGPRIGGLVRRLWPMMFGIVAGTLAGADVLQSENARQASIGLGIVLVIYAVLDLWSVRFTVLPPAERWLGPVVGAATGVITGMTGVFVIPAVPYLAALGLPKDEFVQALGLSFTVSTVALATALLRGGVFEETMVAASALALAPALAGMMLGGWVRGRVSESAFRRCFLLGLLALGAHLAFRS
jgi:uncharacterized protein